MKIFYHIFFRVMLLVLIVSLLGNETGENLKELAIVYVSFLVIVVAVGHKYIKKIMCQSFFVVILGVFTYIDSIFSFSSIGLLIFGISTLFTFNPE